MADRSHLSIGEVLSLLREEFPDVTISKIRFLESQGLVDPERTPSGYRKFYDHDVERLRWILRQQREHFLPLKVIRGRLSEQGGEAGEAGAEEPAAVAAGQNWPAALPGAAASRPSAGPGAGPAPSSGGGAPAPGGPVPPQPAPPPGAAAPGPGGPSSAAPARPATTPTLFASLHSQPEVPAPAVPGPVPAGPVPAAPVPAAPVPAPVAPVPAPADRVPPASPAGHDDDTFTAEELAAAAGAEVGLVSDLKQYGLIAPHAVVAGTPYYDASAVAVTRAAADFARHGVEARHLRIWKNAADREADLFQQVVLPLLRQRNPQARRQAADTLADMARAGAELRAALVERALREIR